MAKSPKSKLAIVIPYYKLRFFKETLESLASQTSKEFNLYIGNDGSPEDPSNLLKSFEGRLDFVYKRFPENIGGKSLTAHWSRCLDMVKDEEWVMIPGDDDLLDSSAVESFSKVLNECDGSATVLRFATVVIGPNGEQLRGPFLGPKRETSIGFIERKFSENIRSSLGEYVFRTDLLKQVGFKDYQLAWMADVLAVIEVGSFGFIDAINQSTVAIRISPLSISGSNRFDWGKSLAETMARREILEVYGSKLSWVAVKKLVKGLENALVKIDLYNLKHLSFIAVMYVRRGAVLETLNLIRRIPYLFKS